MGWSHTKIYVTPKFLGPSRALPGYTCCVVLWSNSFTLCHKAGATSAGIVLVRESEIGCCGREFINWVDLESDRNSKIHVALCAQRQHYHIGKPLISSTIGFITFKLKNPIECLGSTALLWGRQSLVVEYQNLGYTERFLKLGYQTLKITWYTVWRDAGLYWVGLANPSIHMVLNTSGAYQLDTPLPTPSTHINWKLSIWENGANWIESQTKHWIETGPDNVTVGEENKAEKQTDWIILYPYILRSNTHIMN